jgi:cytochrome c-type biogenesis protein CcmH
VRASLLAALLATATALAAQEDPALEKRVAGLAHELRCLVCQNQSLAESNAPLAVDLRNQIREQLAKGASEGDVREFMVARYGDFVLYNPPVKATTWLLWFGPFALLLGGGAIWALVLKRRGRRREGARTARRSARVTSLRAAFAIRFPIR